MTPTKIRRRQFLHLAAGAGALAAGPRFGGRAQVYLTRPVRIFVGFPASATPDIVARLVGQALSERLGQPVVIENRPGAAGNIATEAVVRATPDGYTLLLANGANAVSATLYEKLSFDFIRDIAPVASIGSAALVLVTNLSFPAKTVPEFIAYAKANPGKINMASVSVRPLGFGQSHQPQGRKGGGTKEMSALKRALIWYSFGGEGPLVWSIEGSRVLRLKPHSLLTNYGER
jgi:tripartite-type tricarboxylate transporter receptor subunit TctC